MAAKAAEEKGGARDNPVLNKRKMRKILDRKEVLQSKRKYWALCRVQDVMFSSIALILLFPLMLIIALAIYIDDPKGKPIFTQIRCGRDGKPFKFYKFRSTCVDAESKLDALLKDNEKDEPAF